MDIEVTAEMVSAGWGPRWEALYAAVATPRHRPARVTRVDRGECDVVSSQGRERVRPGPALAKAVDTPGEPSTGDWVAIAKDPGGDIFIDAILPRATQLVRRDPVEGRAIEQVLVANIDTVLLVEPLDRGVNLQRVERFLAAAWDSGATPAVALSKADLADDPAAAREQVAGVASNVDVVVTSARDGTGLDAVRAHLTDNRTLALLGQSGAGKSAMINAIVGSEVQKVGEVRESDSRGRHTTVARELLILPDGGAVIDTPGVRGLGLWDADEGVQQAFPDVQELAAQCRFGDCAHDKEPGCAVKAAIAAGELDARRFRSWKTLQDELDALSVTQDAQARKSDARQWGKMRREANWARDKKGR